MGRRTGYPVGRYEKKVGEMDVPYLFPTGVCRDSRHPLVCRDSRHPLVCRDSRHPLVCRDSRHPLVCRDSRHLRQGHP